MARMPANIASLCRAYTEETVRIVAGIVRSETTPPGVRIQGAAYLWERGWGKPAQTHTLDGDASIQVVIRHIVEGRDAPRVVDAKPLPIGQDKDP